MLSHGEYRESADIDFMISDKEGFRELRQILMSDKGIVGIGQADHKLTLAREIRADQYGIRTMIAVGDVDIKFEIVLEGRIEFEHPGAKDRICGIPTLTKLDMGASKLLANSDRWSDDAVFSRDLIDLAMLELKPSLLKKSIEKASVAYGESVVKDLRKSIESLKARPGRLEECMTSLQMGSVPEALLWSKIRALLKA